jgi:hypothetical protein
MLKPPTTAAAPAGAPRRIRMEIPAPGGRHNMPPGYRAESAVESARAAAAQLAE